jgi:hypothetical protein
MKHSNNASGRFGLEVCDAGRQGLQIRSGFLGTSSVCQPDAKSPNMEDKTVVSLRIFWASSLAFLAMVLMTGHARSKLSCAHSGVTSRLQVFWHLTLGHWVIDFGRFEGTWLLHFKIQ